MRLLDYSHILNFTILNTFLGLINIEQNKIIKIFTVASVIFMPPTLIASIYGMNFEHMPELKYTYGYYSVIAFMFALSIGLVVLFIKRGWIKK